MKLKLLKPNIIVPLVPATLNPTSGFSILPTRCDARALAVRVSKAAKFISVLGMMQADNLAVTVTTL